MPLPLLICKTGKAAEKLRRRRGDMEDWIAAGVDIIDRGGLREDEGWT